MSRAAQSSSHETCLPQGPYLSVQSRCQVGNRCSRLLENEEVIWRQRGQEGSPWAPQPSGKGGAGCSGPQRLVNDSGGGGGDVLAQHPAKFTHEVILDFTSVGPGVGQRRAPTLSPSLDITIY